MMTPSPPMVMNHVMHRSINRVDLAVPNCPFDPTRGSTGATAMACTPQE